MSATAVVGEMRIFVPLEGIVNPDEEIARLNKELAKIEKELDSVTRKLSNSDFLSKANPEAVQKQKDRQAELSAKLTGLGSGLEKIRGLKGASGTRRRVCGEDLFVKRSSPQTSPKTLYALIRAVLFPGLLPGNAFSRGSASAKWVPG